MLSAFRPAMSTQLALPSVGPNEFTVGAAIEEQLHADCILAASLTSQTASFDDLSVSPGVSLMQIEPPQGDSPMSALDTNQPLLPRPPSLPPFQPAVTPYDPQTWLAQMFTSIIDAGISARDSIIRGQTSDATSRGREMIEALRLVTDYMSQYSPNVSEESTDPFNLEHPVVPLPGPLDHAAMTLPLLNEHRKRGSANGFSQPPKASVRKLSHSVTPKSEPEVITIPDLRLDLPAMSPTFATPVPSIATPTAALSTLSRPPSRMFLDPSVFPSQSQPSQFSTSFEMSSQSGQLTPMTTGDMPVNGLSTTASAEPGPQAVTPLPLPLTSTMSLEGPHELAAPVFTNASVPPLGVSSATNITFTPGVSRMTRAARSGSLSLAFERQSSFVAPNAPSNGSVTATSVGPTTAFTPSDATDEGECAEDEDQGESNTTTKHGLEIPADQLLEIDQIFLSFLQSLCSNLDATDKNGEPIHQALMPKKMEKFAQSKDFRPFKFRIQAFTHAFIDELAKHGYTDNKIQCKKVRQYLWRQPFIMRFNEEGKKAKSKGNHIWVIEARKVGDSWEFRKFVRKFANCHSSVCYVGQPWTWAPHIWDPQASLKDVSVRYESQSLPHWLSWKVSENGYVLSGTPPTDAQSVEIRTEAQFIVDGKEERISMSFPLHVTPSPGTRRPSLSDPSKRSMSDSALPQRSNGQSAAILNAPRSDPKFVATVTEVLKVAVQRVQHERMSQNISLEPPQFDALCKQQQVLSRAVNAYTEEQRSPGFLQPTNGSDPQSVLAKTAEQVVVQAVHTVIADRAAGVGVPVASVSKNASIVEVSAITQEALAKALERTTLHAHEVHVMQTTSKVLKEQEQALSPTVSHFDGSMIAETPTLVRVRSVPASLSSVPEHPF